MASELLMCCPMCFQRSECGTRRLARLEFVGFGCSVCPVCGRCYRLESLFPKNSIVDEGVWRVQ